LTDYDDDRHKDDNETIPSSKNVLELTVYVDNEIPEWTPDQEEVLQKMSRYEGGILIKRDVIDTPDKMEACLWYIQNNPRRILWMMGINIHHIRSIMNVLRNTSINELSLADNGLNPDETREVFIMIEQINNLGSISISAGDNNRNRSTYRMDDLVDLLSRNTSLRTVQINDSDIVFERYGMTHADDLLDVLHTNNQLMKLILHNNKSQSREKSRQFVRRVLDVSHRETTDAFFINDLINLRYNREA
jgi:hypothetical protein